MALTPSDKEVELMLEHSLAQEDKKTVSQVKQGKDFENNGQGVIPESVWKNLPGKKIEDSEATE